MYCRPSDPTSVTCCVGAQDGWGSRREGGWETHVATETARSGAAACAHTSNAGLRQSAAAAVTHVSKQPCLLGLLQRGHDLDSVHNAVDGHQLVWLQHR